MLKAICLIESRDIPGKVKGVIYLDEVYPNGPVKMIISITGLRANHEYAFHCHMFGDLSNGCVSLGPHFNPTNKNHGDINDANSHAGDFGNLKSCEHGNIKCEIVAKYIRLRGEFSVIGRSLVIHEKKDDLGKGNNAESLKTGNAGVRIACGIIGLRQ